MVVDSGVGVSLLKRPWRINSTAWLGRDWSRESAKLNPREEKRLADEGLAADMAEWPEY